MKITKEELLHTTKLANLKIDTEEIDSFKADMEEFLTFAKQLDELELSSVLPTVSTIPFENELRQDVIEPSMDRNDVFLNAKNNDGSGITVPKVVE